jgi:hypothetical protein
VTSSPHHHYISFATITTSLLYHLTSVALRQWHKTHQQHDYHNNGSNSQNDGTATVINSTIKQKLQKGNNGVRNSGSNNTAQP